MQCAESLRVQAYFDAEVDAPAAAQIEGHLEHCAECRGLLQDLEALRSSLRRDVGYEFAPRTLRDRLMRALDAESVAMESAPAAESGAMSAPAAESGPENVPAFSKTASPRRALEKRGSFWRGAAGGVGAAAIAASLAFFLAMPRLENPLVNDLVNAHLRSLMPAHLIEVVSTDRHTVKPWFAGHADVSPVVADFEPQGYRLIGGRADYLDHQRSAVVVYQHGAHVINVFSWAADQHPLPGDTTRNGYHLAFWRQGDVQYCAVSDTGWDELLGLERLLRDLGANSGP